MALADSRLLAVVVDEFTSSPSHGSLAAAIVRELLDAWILDPISCPDHIEAQMRAVHAKLRYQFPLAKAAYALLTLDKGSGYAWALVCGDCRVGAVVDESVVWLTDVHTTQSTAAIAGVASSENASHSVTRCFKPRRWHAPQRTQLACSDDYQWALATDGFVAFPSPTMNEAGEDDASCIRFSWTSLKQADGSSGNWYSRMCLPSIR